MRLQHPSGQAAEELAAQFLQAQHCRIIERNWHCPRGEIDLIVLDGSVCVFVEVRMRRSEAFGGAASSITPAKLRKMHLTAQWYLQQRGQPEPVCRFDAVLIDGHGHIQWLKHILEY